MALLVSKTLLSRSRIRKDKIVQYHMGQAFFTRLTQDRKFSLCFAGVFGRSLLYGVGFTGEHISYTGSSNLLEILRSLNAFWQ